MAIHWVLAIQRSFPQTPLGKKKSQFYSESGGCLWCHPWKHLWRLVAVDSTPDCIWFRLDPATVMGPELLRDKWDFCWTTGREAGVLSLCRTRENIHWNCLSRLAIREKGQIWQFNKDSKSRNERARGSLSVAWLPGLGQDLMLILSLPGSINSHFCLSQLELGFLPHCQEEY